MRKLLLILFCSGMAVAASLCGYAYLTLQTAVTPPKAFNYQVKPGTSLTRVAADLHTYGALRHPLALKLLARQRGQSGSIQSGSYYFEAAATPGELLQRLVSGDVVQASLTIPEGFNQQQIVARVAELGYGRLERLQQLCRDTDFIADLNIEANSLEGYLFPETYRFTPGISEDQLLKMMVEQFFSHLDPTLLSKAKTLNLDLHQLVTLASIIEKETGIVEEMPLISAVFHNRLKRGIRLQTDPTVIYGIRDFDGNLTRKHLKTPTPYNTYVIKGLPPGPIASPGLNALRAAAEPATSKYLYFVARGDGSHRFSNTLKEHNQAVREFQLKRRR